MGKKRSARSLARPLNSYASKRKSLVASTETNVCESSPSRNPAAQKCTIQREKRSEGHIISREPPPSKKRQRHSSSRAKGKISHLRWIAAIILSSLYCQQYFFKFEPASTNLASNPGFPGPFGLSGGFLSRFGQLPPNNAGMNDMGGGGGYGGPMELWRNAGTNNNMLSRLGGGDEYSSSSRSNPSYGGYIGNNPNYGGYSSNIPSPPQPPFNQDLRYYGGPVPGVGGGSGGMMLPPNRGGNGPPPIPPPPGLGGGGGYGDWRDIAYTNTMRRLYLSMMHDQFMDQVYRHNMRKRLKWVLLFSMITVFILAWRLTPLSTVLLQAAGVVHGVRSQFELVYSTRYYQIRRYEQSVAAQVCGLSDTDSFNKLSRYCGYRTVLPPHNRARSRIEKTVPIINFERCSTSPPNDEDDITIWSMFGGPQQQQHDGGSSSFRAQSTECMQWILPGNVSLYEAPKPYDRSVELVALPARSVAVSRWFKGRANITTVRRKAADFFNRLEREGFVVDRTQWQLFRYNDAIAFPRYRRNEIAVPVLNVRSVLGH